MRLLNAERRWIFHLSLFCLLFVQNIPLLWMLNTSLRPEAGFLVTDNLRLEEGFTLQNFLVLFRDTDYVRWLVNSLVLAGASSLCATVAGYLLAFALVYHSKFGAIRNLVTIAYLIPPMFVIFPLQFVLRRLSMPLVFISLVPIFQLFLFPLATWIACAYSSGIPRGQIVLGQLDGLPPRLVFRLVFLPTVGRGVPVTFALCFVFALQEFIYSFVFLHDSSAQTVPVGTAEMQAGDVYQWAQIAGAGVFTAGICVTLLVLLRRPLAIALEKALGA